MTEHSPKFIDITKPKEQVVGQGGVKITSTTWDPRKGAQEALQRTEARIREEYELEKLRESEDPTNQRIARLEDTVAQLMGNYVGLRKDFAEWRASQ